LFCGTQHVVIKPISYSAICLLCEVIIMSAVNLIGISGSLRRQSANTGLLRAAKAQLPADTTLDIADLSDIPFYNEDITEVPASVARVLKQIGSADALVLACPEYNYSIAPALKNIIDWASRSTDKTLLAGKPVAIMGAGGGMGTSRAQYHLRQVCISQDLRPLNRPEVFASAFAGGFDQDGNLTDEKIKGLIKTQLSVLVDTVKRNK
jgi:chromate reductase